MNEAHFPQRVDPDAADARYWQEIGLALAREVWRAAMTASVMEFDHFEGRVFFEDIPPIDPMSNGRADDPIVVEAPSHGNR
jgi:hypothetical protein